MIFPCKMGLRIHEKNLTKKFLDARVEKKCLFLSISPQPQIGNL
jgi:hypothetical protein